MKRFTLGSSNIGELEKRYVNNVLTNNYISPGPVVQHVEKECAKLHNFKHGLSTNSGQTAIHIALQAMIETRLGFRSIKKKPLVAVPACTYISTLAATILAGCDIILVDVEIPSANMFPPSLVNTIIYQREIGDPVDIVIPVHLFGKACDVQIRDICKRYNVLVIEDACESTFATNIGWGDILTTSFYTNHLISAGGGGMIMTNDDDLDEYCWKLVNHGRSSRFNNDDIYRISEKFHFDIWGHSAKWNDVSAAIAKAQIERRQELYAARHQNAMVLNDCLIEEDLDQHLIFRPKDENNSWMMYPIVLNELLDSNKIIKELNDHGVEVRRMMPITNQPVVQKYFGGDLAKEFPNADEINRQGFYVGCHPELSIDDMCEMGKIIRKAIHKNDSR